MSDDDLKRQIIAYWIQGLTVREIADRVGLGKTRVAELIQGYRKTEPSIDEVKEVWQLAKKNGLNLRDLPRVGVFKAKLDELDLSTEELPNIKYLEKYGDKAPDVLQHGVKLAALEESEHKTYTQISAEYPVLASSVKSLRGEKATLLKQNEELASKIRDLQGLLNLQNQLDLLHVNTATMNNFVAKHKKLASLGFTETSAEILGEELARKGLMPEEASEKVIEAIEKYGSIDAAIATEEDTLSSLKEDVKTQEKALAEAQKLTEKAKVDFGKLRDKLDQDIKDAIAHEKLREEEQKKKLIAADERLAMLQAKSQEISEMMDFASAIDTLCRHPEHLTNLHFEVLIKRLQGIRVARNQQHWKLSEDLERSTKGDLVRGLVDIVEAEVVSKEKYDNLEQRYNKTLSEKSALEKFVPENRRLQEELESLRKDLAYASGIIGSSEKFIQNLSDFLAGRIEGSNHGGALYTCPGCKFHPSPRALNKENFSATLTVTCHHCDGEYHPSLEELYMTYLKFRRGLDSVGVVKKSTIPPSNRYKLA